MPVIYVSDDGSPRVVRYTKRYGFFHFLFDLIMVFLTCGLWLIWVIIRELRDR